MKHPIQGHMKKTSWMKPSYLPEIIFSQQFIVWARLFQLQLSLLQSCPCRKEFKGFKQVATFQFMKRKRIEMRPCQNLQSWISICFSHCTKESLEISHCEFHELQSDFQGSQSIFYAQNIPSPLPHMIGKHPSSSLASGQRHTNQNPICHACRWARVVLIHQIFDLVKL